MQIPPIKFGFLPEPWEIDEKDFAIEPLPDYDERLAKLQSIEVQGYICPPVLHTRRFTEEKPEGFIVPGSQHVVQMLKIFPSHTLTLKNCKEKDPMRGSAGFIIHFLAFLAGTRLQFEDWWIDGRVPFGKEMWRTLPFFKPDLPKLVQRAFTKYKSLKRLVDKKGKVISAKTRKMAFLNALYVLGKSKSCEFEWEAFLLKYMALDAIWRASDLEKRHGNIGHGERIEKLVKEFKLFESPKGRAKDGRTRTEELVDLRNDIIHECNWDNGFLGEAARKEHSQYAPSDLDMLLEQLIFTFAVEGATFPRIDWTKSGLGPPVRIPQ